MKNNLFLAVLVFVFSLGRIFANTSMAVHPNGRQIITSCFTDLIVWDIATGEKITTFGDYEATPGYKIMALTISPDGKRLAARYNAGILMWDIGEYEVLWSIEDGYAWHGVFSFSPDSSKLVYYSIGDSEDEITGSVIILDANNGDKIVTVEEGLRTIYALAYSPDGDQVAGALNSSIKVWNARTGREIRTLSGHTDRVASLSYNRDGQKLISCSDDKNIKIWNSVNWQEITSISTGYSSSYGGYSMVSIALSSDDNLVVSVPSNRDNSIKLWDMITGVEVLSLPGGWYAYACFINNNTQIISHRRGAFTTETITIWDRSNGNIIREIKIPGDNES